MANQFKFAIISMAIVAFLSHSAQAESEAVKCRKLFKASNSEASKHCKKAIEQGDIISQLFLDIINGKEVDEEAALILLRKGADKGSADAQFILGELYLYGKNGVKQNHSEALIWFQKAAAQNSDDAQLSLGNMYLNGEGAKKDYTEASKWLRLSANQGNVEAQTILGKLYIDGEGEYKNYVEAMKWFRKAADQSAKESEKPLQIKNNADVITWYLKEVDINNYNKAIEIIDNIQNKSKPEKSLVIKKIELLKTKVISLIYSKEPNGDDDAVKTANMIEDEYNMLIKLDPKNAKNYYDLGDMFGQAVSSFRIKRSTNIDNYSPSGKVKDMGNKAIKYLTKAIAIKANESEYFSTRANIYETMNQNENALKDYTKAISLKPNKSEYYSSRASLYSNKEMYLKAISDMTNAIEYYNRGDSEIGKYTEILNYNSRALYYEMVLDYEKALSDYKTVCELSDNKRGCDKIEKMTKNISRGKKWVNYSGNSDTKSFYDKTNIVKSDKSKYKVWVRNEQDAESMIKSMLALGVAKDDVAKYNNYSYSMIYYTLDCKNREVGAYSLTEYDESSSVISSHSPEKVKMTPIVPDSFSESLFKAICK